MSLYNTKRAETYDGALRLSVMATNSRPSYSSYAANLQRLSQTYANHCTIAMIHARPNIADSSLGIWKGCANSSPTSNWTMSCHTFDNNTLRMKSDVDVSKVCCYNLPSDASSSLSPAKMCGGFLCPTIRIPTLRTSLRL